VLQSPKKTKVNLENHSSASQMASKDFKSESQPISNCRLIIKLARTDVSDQFAFQVDSFNAKDSECWEALKQHGITFCQSKFLAG
jgi:hypothetical protein